MKITAAVVREKEQPFFMKDLKLEDPRAAKILVRVAALGCATRI